MMIALSEEEWLIFRNMTLSKLRDILSELAEKVNLDKYRKNRRGPKKEATKREKYQKHPHVSTAKLLAGIKPSD